MFLRTTIALLIIISSFTGLQAQEKSRKQQKQEKEELQKREYEQLLESLSFVFYAGTARPQGFSPVNLSPEKCYVVFEPDTIVSLLPFFGKTYGSISFGDDTGLNFSGKPDEYKLTRDKRGFTLKTKVHSGTVSYRLLLTVSFSGYASLTINSNNRSPISFSGGIGEELITDPIRE